MLFYHKGSPVADLSSADFSEGIASALAAFGKPGRLLIVPPDITRLHSHAGEITRCVYEQLPDSVSAIIPALGTHLPMTDSEIGAMFGNLPKRLFSPHRWRSDCKPVGAVPADFVEAVSEGAVTYEIPVSVNSALFDPSFDCILSISQVVPHEVAGMAGYSKNIVVGLGGAQNIHHTHFLGAAYGMERIMGRADSPVRKVLNYACKEFLGKLPLIHAITVIGADERGTTKIRGFFIGNDDECYQRAAHLSRAVNVHALEKPLAKVVVYLDPLEYKSTWLGNKSIYRTRMAIADGGELVVLAPGVKLFGEDPQIDALIRTFGYRGTPAIMKAVKKNEGLQNNLSAAAHLIHGSSEGRFSITYCAGGLDRKEIEKAGFKYAPLNEMMKRYDPKTLSEGYNRIPDGEEIYYISAPGTGLWAWREKFEDGMRERGKKDVKPPT
ncbi:MAG: DUF2088 domain-containing protein [Chitinispirillaceae bacterium]|nr:DUF2088 domain-containing protein [Chitinispirillaceae bacterium]